MRLQLLTWVEAEDFISRSDAVIVPIGSTEQHGPNGLIGTDTITAEAIAVELGERAGALVAPPISVGVAQHHMAFAGSMTLRPSTLGLVIEDWVSSLAHHGLRKFYFLNGHGGNVSTLKTTFERIKAKNSNKIGEEAFNCAFRNWWSNDAVKKISNKLYGDMEGYHATPSEVAVAQFLEPEHIKQVKMDPAPKIKPQIFGAEDYRIRYPDGRMSSYPAMARPSHGEQIFEASVTHLVQDFKQFSA
jgi:creatinine amidohydrolase